MIKSRLKILIANREVATGERITYASLATAVGLSKTTLNRFAENKTDRIDFVTLNKLCCYFDCAIGDLLEFVPDEKAVKSKKK